MHGAMRRGRLPRWCALRWSPGVPGSSGRGGGSAAGVRSVAGEGGGGLRSRHGWCAAPGSSTSGYSNAPGDAARLQHPRPPPPHMPTATPAPAPRPSPACPAAAAAALAAATAASAGLEREPRGRLPPLSAGAGSALRFWACGVGTQGPRGEGGVRQTHQGTTARSVGTDSPLPLGPANPPQMHSRWAAFRRHLQLLAAGTHMVYPLMLAGTAPRKGGRGGGGG
jgi:hypothetical protein